MPDPPPLLDRDQESAELDAVLRRAMAGDGNLVVLAGPAGIGKTSLALDLADRATTAGCTVLRSRGDELEQDFAFGLALQLFEPHVAALAPAARDALFDGPANLARPLLEARTVLPDENDLYPVLHGLYWVTDHLADATPLVLLVDNLHLADPASIRFLRYLVPRVADLPVLVAATVRTPDVPAAVERLLHEPGATIVRPRPLSRDAVEDLVTARFDDADDDLVATCAALSGGNPLLLQELLACLALPDPDPLRSIVPEETNDPGADPHVAEAVVVTTRRRLDRATAPARRLAEAAAVAGGGTPLLRGAEIAGLDAAAAQAAAEELLSSAVLHTADPLTFSHGLVRHGVLSGIGPSEMAAYHAAAARTLGYEGAPPERIAQHLLRTRPAGDADVARTLLAAARSIRHARAPSEAVRLAERALAEPPAPDDVPDVLVELAKAQALSGDPGWRDRSADALRSDEGGWAALSIGRVLFAAGDLASAAELFRTGSERADPDSELGLNLLAGYAAATRLDIGAHRNALDRIAALEARRPLGATPAERALLCHLAYERSLHDGTAHEVIALANRAVEPATVTDAEIVNGLHFFSGVLALQFADGWAQALAALDRASEAARGMGSPGTHAAAANYRSVNMLQSGLVEQAVTEAEDAVAGIESGGALLLPGCRGNLALALLERGDPEAAEAALALPGDPARWARTASYTFWLHVRGVLALQRGDVEAALADQRTCGERQAAMGALNPATIPWRAQAVQALLALGRTEEAATLDDEQMRAARAFGAPRSIAVALRTRALIRRDDARELLLEAVALLEGRGLGLEEARCLLQLAMSCRRAGLLTEARGHARDALALAEVGGAETLASRAADELRAAGARVRRTAVTGAEALTPGERRVAELAATGSTNRVIAEQLFVSVKAVEYHLSNAYRKLGITKRADLSAALEA